MKSLKKFLFLLLVVFITTNVFSQWTILQNNTAMFPSAVSVHPKTEYFWFSGRFLKIKDRNNNHKGELSIEFGGATHTAFTEDGSHFFACNTNANTNALVRYGCNDQSIMKFPVGEGFIPNSNVRKFIIYQNKLYIGCARKAGSDKQGLVVFNGNIKANIASNSFNNVASYQLISDLDVEDMEIANDGSVFILTPSSIFKQEKGVGLFVKIYEGEKTGLYFPNHITKGPDGTIWVACEDRLLLKYLGNNSFEKNILSISMDKNLHNIIVDKHNIVWLANYDLISYDPVKKTSLFYNRDDYSWLHKLCLPKLSLDWDGELLVTAYNAVAKNGDINNSPITNNPIKKMNDQFILINNNLKVQKPGLFNIKIFKLNGQVVKQLSNNYDVGNYNLTPFFSKNISSGNYIMKILLKDNYNGVENEMVSKIFKVQ